MATQPSPAPRRPSPRLPWRALLATALSGLAALAAGIVLTQDWLAMLGALVTGLSPLWMLVPVLRAPPDPSRRGYSDMNDLGAFLTIFGFTVKERDAAFSRSRERRRRGGAPDPPGPTP
jgi:hypothetical protein